MGLAHEHRLRYRRRTPGTRALHRLVSSTLGPLRARLTIEDPYGRGLPRYVERELEEYLRCGLLEHGFARVVCRGCREEHLVAFSCKVRGLCPSCTARRMFDTAAHLIDRVLPRVPVRQWVLTFSRQVRYHLAADPKLASEVVTRALRTLFAWQRRRARALGERPSRQSSCGAIPFVQRFNSALELSYHLHILIPEGLFVRQGEDPDAAPRFVELSAPSDVEVEHLLGQLITRTERHLRKRGRLDEDEADVAEPGLELFASQPLCHAPAATREPAPPPPLCARRDGYSLHAATWLRADDREGLERLCRYCLRPPLSLGRLEAHDDGGYTYRMKRRFADGRQVLRFTGEALLRRLIALIPPPRVHLVRYAGIFAPHALSRYALTGRGLHERPTPAPGAELHEQRRIYLLALCRARGPSDPERPRRLDWATLLRRAFAIDVLVCPRCEGPIGSSPSSSRPPSSGGSSATCVSSSRRLAPGHASALQPTSSTRLETLSMASTRPPTSTERRRPPAARPLSSRLSLTSHQSSRVLPPPPRFCPPTVAWLHPLAASLAHQRQVIRPASEIVSSNTAASLVGSRASDPRALT